MPQKQFEEICAVLGLFMDHQACCGDDPKWIEMHKKFAEIVSRKTLVSFVGDSHD